MKQHRSDVHMAVQLRREVKCVSCRKCSGVSRDEIFALRGPDGCPQYPPVAGWGGGAASSSALRLSCLDPAAAGQAATSPKACPASFPGGRKGTRDGGREGCLHCGKQERVCHWALGLELCFQKRAVDSEGKPALWGGSPKMLPSAMQLGERRHAWPMVLLLPGPGFFQPLRGVPSLPPSGSGLLPSCTVRPE